MTLAELGSLIREKRQSKNLSIEEVSAAIKIHQQSLEAIEQGDLNFIGYETYFKSFLKCYMLYLGYSFEEYQNIVNTVEDFSDENTIQKILKPQYAEAEEEKSKPRDKKLAIQLLVLAILGGSAYFYFSQNTAIFGGDKAETPFIEEKAEKQPAVKNETVKETIVAETQVQVSEQPVAAEGKSVQETSEAGTAQTENADGKTQNLAGKDKEQTDIATPETEPKTSDAAVQPIQEQKQEQKNEEPVELAKFLKENPSARVIDWTKVDAPQNGEQQAVMYANQDCWMQYSQDSKSGHFIIRKGEQRVFNFKQHLDFKIANGSAITLFHDKKPVTVGDSTKVREVNLK